MFREEKKMMAQGYSHTGRFGPGEVEGHILPKKSSQGMEGGRGKDSWVSFTQESRHVLGGTQPREA